MAMEYSTVSMTIRRKLTSSDVHSSLFHFVLFTALSSLATTVLVDIRRIVVSGMQLKIA